jgi:DNA-binding response OmpR family regulator
MLTNETIASIPPTETLMELRRILHVDDDPDIRLLMSASLREFGYIVVTAGTVAEALQLAKEYKFDLFILDVRLPDGTGIELCQELRQLQPGVAIAYYSAYAEEEEQKAALCKCGDTFMKKPVSASTLEQTVIRLLRDKGPRINGTMEPFAA